MERLITSAVKALEKLGLEPVVPSGNGSAVVSTFDPLDLFARWIGAASSGQSVLLLDPHWVDHEREIWASKWAGEGSLSPEIALTIASGGTGGKRKFCHHSWTGLEAAIDAYIQLYGGYAKSTAIILSPYSIGGWMAVLRSWRMGGEVRFFNYQDWLEKPEDLSNQSLSLVPTQLRRLLDTTSGIETLRSCPLILIGGAGLSEPLREKALEHQLALAPCFGATETAALVAGHTPESWRADPRGVGKALAHADFKVDSEGRLTIRATSLCRGLWPDQHWNPLCWETSDRASLDVDGILHLEGRLDRMINSGGKKIDLQEVEDFFAAIPAIRDIIAYGVDDPDWGQRLEVMIEGNEALEPEVRQAMKEKLAPWKIPKCWRWVKRVPRTQQGKPDWNRISR